MSELNSNNPVSKGVATVAARAKRLFQYLSERARLRAGAVQDIRGDRKRYPEVLYLSDLPDEPEIFSAHRVEPQEQPPDAGSGNEGAPSNEIVDDAPLLHVERIQPPATPLPPKETHAWLRGGQDSLTNWKAEPPTLMEFVLEPVFGKSPTTGATVQLEDRKVMLTERPRIGQLWSDYINRQWKPWAKERARLEPVRQWYTHLFELHTQLEREGEDYELVICSGLLAWQLGKDTLFRHLVSLPARIDLDPKTGRIALTAATGTSFTRLETEMLPKARQPSLDGLPDIERSPTGDSTVVVSSPLARIEVIAALRGWCNRLDSSTMLSDSVSRPKTVASDGPPVVVFAPAIVLRKRPAISMTVACEQCARQVEAEGNVPFNIARVVDVLEDKEGSGRLAGVDDDNRAYQSDAPLFPLPFNDEQVRIAKRLSGQRGVLVQGPPGTGKTHTIANLICHLLAQGNRILVTSAKARPLNVLHEKLPNDLKPLCLTSLGGGREETERLRAAVNGILDRHSTFDGDQSRHEEEQLEATLTKLAAERAQLTNMRKRRWELEVKSDNKVAGGKYVGQVMSIAENVSAKATEFGWFPDEIASEQAFLLSVSELVQFEQFLRDTSPEIRAECAKRLPALEKLIAPSEFRAAVSEHADLERLVLSAKGDIEGISQKLKAEQDSRLVHLRTELSAAREQHKKAQSDFAVASAKATRERARLNSRRAEIERECDQQAAKIKEARQPTFTAAESAYTAALRVCREVKGVPGSANDIIPHLLALDAGELEQIGTALEILSDVVSGKLGSAKTESSTELRSARFGTNWLQHAAHDLLSGRGERWIELHDSTAQDFESLPPESELTTLTNLTLDMSRVPAGTAPEQVVFDARSLLAHFESGGNLGGWFSTPPVVKQTQYIIKHVRVNGTPCCDRKSVAVLVQFLEVEQSLRSLADKWKSVGAPPSSLDVERTPLDRLAKRIAENHLTPLRSLLESTPKVRTHLGALNPTAEHFSSLCKLVGTVLVAKKCRWKLDDLQQQLTRELNGLTVERDTQIGVLEKSFVPASQADVEKAKAEVETLEREIVDQRDAIADEYERELAPLRQQIAGAESQIAKVGALLQTSRAHLAELAKSPTAHSMCDVANAALAERDSAKYARAHERLSAVAAVMPRYESARKLLERIREHAPRLAGEIWNVVLDEGWQARLRALPDAWCWAQARSWVRDFRKLVTSDLDTRLERNEAEASKALAKKAANLAWRHCLEAGTEEQKRALSAWQQAMRRVGQGKGKYADKHRRDATRQMRTAQGMIPALVTPLARLVESLPIRPKLFDVAIVDEASQLGPEGLLLFYLAEKVVVVGDDQQISPEDVGVDLKEIQALAKKYLHDVPQAERLEQESVFNLASMLFSGGRIVLKEHFRCMREIIQFSNELCYRDETGTPQLVPLRKVSGERLEPVLKTVFVANGFREGDVNPIEVQAMVKAIQACAENPEYKDKSFGVISLLGGGQADKIQRALLEALGSEEVERRRLICGDAYAFQGDERDVMFLSLVIANNERFMQLTKESDKRRFNVAASRARDQMWLFHSVPLEDLKPDDLRYRLLHHCRTLPEAAGYSFDEQVALCDSQFERHVANSIGERGYRVYAQFKVSGYRIDLVVEGANGKQLAVECDGDHWHGPEQFDADTKRQRILERCGWKFWRVWGSEFYENRQQALSSLWAMLEAQDIRPFVPEF